ncbi:AbrB family transcriptional regulator [Variovorax sp. RHLX14]|uniref:AbrB family transcriptional regulator n=1 Tax=Variovorax sp. RHLX14 TaxID=1259731 RepID=UPI003F465018
MSLRFHSRVVVTLLFAAVAAFVCRYFHTPLPWMIGPLLAVSIASVSGAPTASASWLRNIGQWIIGAALGLYFTPQVVALVVSVWWAIALAIGWALLAGWGFGRWLERQNARRMPQLSEETMRATAYFSGAIGGASEMTLLAERVGARTDLVAAAHSLRLMIVTITVPFAMQWSGLHGLDLHPSPVRLVDATGLALLAAATGAGARVMRATGRTNPWFIGPLVFSICITAAGWSLSAIPQWLTNAAQVVIAVSLGVRFSREFLHTAPRWMLSVAGGTVFMMLICAAFAAVLAWSTGLHPATLILGTSPGGIAEMSITAKVLQLGVPVVTAFQVCRLIAVLLIVGPMYRWIYGRRSA